LSAVAAATAAAAAEPDRRTRDDEIVEKINKRVLLFVLSIRTSLERAEKSRCNLTRSRSDPREIKRRRARRVEGGEGGDLNKQT
jgi:hypothetical protein